MKRKYGNKPITIGGIKFDSTGEGRRWVELAAMQKAGLITHLSRQVVYVLAPSVIILGRKRPPLRYIADFIYNKRGYEVVEDYKGRITEGYRIKRHLMKSVHNIDIFETGCVKKA